jgi:glycine hydroxymethyltransferase
MTNLKSKLQKTDPQVYSLIQAEEKRQQTGLEMIPSENYISPAVRVALSSVFTNKYSEGYPGKRYYGGNEVVDKLESLAIKRAKNLFGVKHVNVQPYSGSPANLAVHSALCKVGDPILSQHLSHGGHLSMGQKANFSSQVYKAHYYSLTKQGEVDFDELAMKAKKFSPKVIWAGGTAYTKKFDFARYGQIADQVGAYFVADIAHIAGLVVAGVHPSPVDHAHLVTTTTHKTLRGPRGGMIMATKKGLKKDGKLSEKIDRAVFPGLQGGPHENQIAALAVALKEAGQPEFKQYVRQIVVNAKSLADVFGEANWKLVGGGTENHMIWVDFTDLGIDGWQAQYALDAIGISSNRQTVPFDSRSAYYPSGIRLGTPAVTTRGMKEKEMKLIGEWIVRAVKIAKKMGFKEIGSKNKEKDQQARKEFKKELKIRDKIQKLRSKIVHLCQGFPLP